MAFYVQSGPTIPAGESLSDDVACLGNRITRIVMPPDWTAAPLSFEVSPDGVSFYALHHIQVTTDKFVSYETIVPVVEPGSIVAIPSDMGDNISAIKFRSGTKSLPVPQAADRVFQIVLAA